MGYPDRCGRVAQPQLGNELGFYGIIELSGLTKDNKKPFRLRGGFL